MWSLERFCALANHYNGFAGGVCHVRVGNLGTESDHQEAVALSQTGGPIREDVCGRTRLTWNTLWSSMEYALCTPSEFRNQSKGSLV